MGIHLSIQVTTPFFLFAQLWPGHWGCAGCMPVTPSGSGLSLNCELDWFGNVKVRTHLNAFWSPPASAPRQFTSDWGHACRLVILGQLLAAAHLQGRVSQCWRCDSSCYATSDPGRACSSVPSLHIWHFVLLLLALVSAYSCKWLL